MTLRTGRGEGLPFLRIPPFPGARLGSFPQIAQAPAEPLTDELLAALRAERVGGTYWAAPLRAEGRLVVRLGALPEPARLQDLAGGTEPLLLPPAAEVDPWSLLDGAAALLCEEEDEARLVAFLLGVPVHVMRRGRAERADDGQQALERALARLGSLASPFDGAPLPLAEAISLCGFWRGLVESNRPIVGALGFAFWKQAAVAPLLWGGAEALPFWRRLPSSLPPGEVALWRAKAPAEEVAELERRKVPLIEVEDGFLRSSGLGADCVPPLSITVDRLGPYFDPAQPSELELLLGEPDFGPDLLERARRLRLAIVEAGLGKYGRGRLALPRFDPVRRHVLVPGQVEDDRSVMTGGGGMTNVELLRRVRERCPDAFLIYKPHPDVEAGHRRGAVPAEDSRALADLVVTDLPVAALIELADEVHVISSLTGFEALLRGKEVTTYGVPFYAGWGLTTDLGRVPARRNARITLDQLVAATMLVYPRYLDPETGLPCPAEVVLARLTSGAPEKAGLLVRLRRLQGRLRRAWHRLGAR
jgi:capsular polysaccharide export protein